MSGWRRGLWAHSDFRWLWAGNTVSRIGSQVSFLALPLVAALTLGATPLQMGLTITLGLGIGRLFGWAWVPSLWFGALIALSSTMVILKTLMSQGLLGTLSSRVMVGMLIIQDLAVVPLMLILPQLDNLETGLPVLGWAVVRAVIFLIAMIYGGSLEVRSPGAGKGSMLCLRLPIAAM